MTDQPPIVIDRTGADIHAELAALRRRGPVSRIELPGSVRAWSVTGYEAALSVLGDTRFSKDPRKHWPAFVDGEIGADFPLIGWVLMDNLTTAHGADHSRLRRLTAKAFTPRRVEAMRPVIEQAAAELLDELAAAAPGEAVDLKKRFAHPLPARVICDLFGVEPEERADLLRGGEVNVDTTTGAEEAAANVERWHRQMHDFVERKRRTPGDDLTSDLVAAQETDGSRLTPSELVGTLHLMLATGTEPVMNLIGNAVLALLTHPEQYERVRAGHAGWDDVIEETLRAEAPVAHLPFRFATEDVEVGGVTVRRGEPVLIGFAATGRDPEVHGADADRFELSREDKSHLAFGSGVYRCIGMPLARAELRIALPALFARFPEMALAVRPEQLKPQSTFIMNGVESLPVRLAPKDDRG
ncbi:cytochrome P450 [Streptomyces sp. NPDC046985]|uniref:cytochrome P450 family protein n=1 Tax=Streptomyces sp. NPDC046985 TaxID=3155377 RepID=UPI0033D7E507